MAEVGDPQRCGKYLLLEPIGSGGMGTVYRARDTALDRLVAIKLLRDAADEATEAKVRFSREARALAQLSHPNIVPVYEVGTNEDGSWLAMELVEGGSLRDEFARRGASAPSRLPTAVAGSAEIAAFAPPSTVGGTGGGVGSDSLAGWRRQVEWIVTIARAVHHAHERGVLHRDLKPENILLRREDGAGGSVTPVLADFGLARSLDETRGLTRSGQVLGTPDYMSPEQCEGKREADARSDVFSLGVVLYEAITGRKPFAEDGTLATMYAVIVRDPVPPRRLNPQVSVDLETVVLKALEKEPERRFATAAELADELERALGGREIASRPVTVWVRAGRRALRHPVAAAVAAACALVLAGAVGLLALTDARERRELEDALASARLAAANARWTDARDGFRRALALDADRGEAQAGLARAEAELVRAAAAAEAERMRARTAQAEAEEALRKAGRVQAVLSRWLALAGPVSALERSFYDSTLAAERKREEGDRRWPAVEGFMTATPDDPVSRAAMRSLAGWARRLAGYEPEGLEWMAEARATDPSLPYGAFLAALAHLSDYLAQQPLPEITASGGELVLRPGIPETPAMKALRARIDALVGDAVATAGEWGGESALGYRNAADAVRAMQAGNWAEAERRFTEVLGAEATLFFRSDLLFARGKVRYFLGRFEEGEADLTAVVGARTEWAEAYFTRGELLAGWAVVRLGRKEEVAATLDRAIADFAAAIARDPGHLRAYVHRGVAHLTRADGEVDRRGDPRPHLQSALADFDEVTRRDPDLAVAHNDRGYAWLRVGQDLARRGEDALPSFEQAVASLTRAVELGADDRRSASNNRGYAQVRVGEVRATRGEDPREWYRKAIADLDEAQRIDPSGFVAVNRAEAWMRLADAEAGRGTDARESYRRAVADYDEVLGRQPGEMGRFIDRAHCRRRLGEEQAARGEDPWPAYEGALADYDEAVRLGTPHPNVLGHRGQICWAAAERARQEGRDPAEWEARAFADFERALQREPANVVARAGRGYARLRRGERAAAAGSDPREDYRGAVSDLDEVLRAKPGDFNACLWRSTARWKLGQLEVAAGGDPFESYAGALVDCDETVRIRPSSFPARSMRAAIRIARGDAVLARHEDPRADYGLALADLDEAVRLRPQAAEVRNQRGLVRVKVSRVENGLRLDSRGTYERAEADFSAALDLRPNYAAAWLNRGDARVLKGDMEQVRGDDPRPSWEQGMDDYRQALEKTKSESAWVVRTRLGQALMRLERFTEAVDELDQAWTERPDNEEVRKLLAEARAKATK